METIFKLGLVVRFDPRGGHNHYNCDIIFFKQWTDEMAYVLGFLYADGDIIDAVSSRTQYVKFTSADRTILGKIKMVMNSEHPLHVRPSQNRIHRNGVYKSRELFFLRIGSRRMFNDLKRLGVTPNKSKTAVFPKIPLFCLNHFVRGYFDGDGCVYFYKTKDTTKPIIAKRLSIIFTSGSFTFLKELGKILKNHLTLNQEMVYKSNRAFQLRYSMSDSLKIFKFLYKSHSQRLYLERKFNIFKNYFELSPQKIDPEIRSILKNLS